VVSAPGAGTKFCVTLPIVPQDMHGADVDVEPLETLSAASSGRYSSV
jgi:hypothetical protein